MRFFLLATIGATLVSGGVINEVVDAVDDVVGFVVAPSITRVTRSEVVVDPTLFPGPSTEAIPPEDPVPDPVTRDVPPVSDPASGTVSVIATLTVEIGDSALPRVTRLTTDSLGVVATIVSTQSSTATDAIVTSGLHTIGSSDTSGPKVSTRTSTETETGASDPTSAVNSPGGGFWSNKMAVAATFTVMGVLLIGGMVALAWYIRRRMSKGGQEDGAWDNSSMNEYAVSRPFGFSSPTPAFVGGRHAGSASGHGHDDDVDEMLSMPPVKNHERLRDSAFDIVPSFPPPGRAPPSSYPYNTSNAYTRRPYDPSTPRIARVPPPKYEQDFVDATRETQPSPGGVYGSQGKFNAASGYAMPPYHPSN